MARYHAIVNGGTIPVYAHSDCDPTFKAGDLYNGEVFTYLGVTTGYNDVYEVRFLDPNNKYRSGFIHTGSYGNLAYSGLKTSISGIGSCYYFTLRRSLNVVTNSGAHKTTLPKGSKVYTKTATAGESNPANMKIVGYNINGKVTVFDGFVTLNYVYGSMLASNFCLMK